MIPFCWPLSGGQWGKYLRRPGPHSGTFGPQSRALGHWDMQNILNHQLLCTSRFPTSRRSATATVPVGANIMTPFSPVRPIASPSLIAYASIRTQRGQYLFTELTLCTEQAVVTVENMRQDYRHAPAMRPSDNKSPHWRHALTTLEHTPRRSNLPYGSLAKTSAKMLKTFSHHISVIKHLSRIILPHTHQTSTA